LPCEENLTSGGHEARAGTEEKNVDAVMAIVRHLLESVDLQDGSLPDKLLNSQPAFSKALLETCLKRDDVWRLTSDNVHVAQV
jgi:hypothetical protein